MKYPMKTAIIWHVLTVALLCSCPNDFPLTVWTRVPNPFIRKNGTSYSIRAIAWGNNKFVAGDYEGKMAYSYDGIIWTAVSNSTLGSVQAIVWGNNKFVAGGHGLAVSVK